MSQTEQGDHMNTVEILLIIHLKDILAVSQAAHPLGRQEKCPKTRQTCDEHFGRVLPGF